MGGGGFLGLGPAPSAPAAPDYSGAARETAAGNVEAARVATAANRVNQVTPYGTLTYTQTGQDPYGNPMWTATQALSPEQQQLLDVQNRLSQRTGGLAEKGVGYLMKYISKDESKHKYPKGVRIYGYGGVDVFVRRKVRFFRASSSIRRQVADSGLTYKDVDIRRVPGGKCDILSGWFFPSLWKCVILKGVPVFFRVFEDENEGAMLVDISERIDYYTDVKEI